MLYYSSSGIACSYYCSLVTYYIPVGYVDGILAFLAVDCCRIVYIARERSDPMLSRAIPC